MEVRRREPALQVTDQRLTADEELVGERVPGPDLDLSAAHGALEPSSRFGPDLQVIVDHDRLSVHQESEVGIGLGQGEQLVPQLDELGPEALKGGIPLPIPVGVRHDVDGGGRGLGHS